MSENWEMCLNDKHVIWSIAGVMGIVVVKKHDWSPGIRHLFLFWNPSWTAGVGVVFHGHVGSVTFGCPFTLIIRLSRRNFLIQCLWIIPRHQTCFSLPVT